MSLNRLIASILLVAAIAGSPWSLAQHGRPGGASVAPGKFSILGYTAPVPKEWQSQTPASTMRAAQFVVPAAKGAAEGEMVVFYFGKGQGGTVAANTERWTSQFSTPDGKPVKPKLDSFAVSGMPVTTVELNGNYSRGVGMGQQGQGRPDQTLLVAIIETPEGNVTFQLYGDRKTVAAHRKAFEAMLRGFKRST